MLRDSGDGISMPHSVFSQVESVKMSLIGAVIQDFARDDKCFIENIDIFDSLSHVPII